MLKADLRKRYLEKRKAITTSQKNKWEDLLLIQFQKLGLPIPNNLLTYAPLANTNEYDPHLVEKYAAFKNPELQLIYPKIKEDFATLECLLTTEETYFELNKWGIAEPASGDKIPITKIEMVFVPLLCFDLLGTRVGYGKGFYDKLLAGASNNTVKIGFSFFNPIIELGSVESFDIPLDYCLTPEKIYSF